jgi:hypothetical protein
MRGKELTRPTDNLGQTFFHIRTSRDSNARRSWQRRARMALGKRDDLTPAERHEIMCTWSRDDCHMVRSAAMAKILGTTINSDYQHKQPTLRARFLNNGQKPDTKKPEQIRLDFGDAANDATACIPDKPQRLPHPCTHALAAYRARLLSQTPQRSYQHRHAHAQGDSDAPSALVCDTHLHQHGPQLQMQTPTNNTPSKQVAFSFKELQIYMSRSRYSYIFNSINRPSVIHNNIKSQYTPKRR